MHREIGSLIKELRLNRGMTLKELGQKANLSVSYLSTLERGLCSASIITLQNISRALEVDSSTLIMDNKENDNIIMRSYGRMLIRLDESRRIYQGLVEKKSANHPFYPMLVTLLPGRDLGQVVPYSHAGEELIYVLEGVLTVVLKHHCYDLHEGNTAHYFASTPHEWMNRTYRLVKLISFTTDSAIGDISNYRKE